MKSVILLLLCFSFTVSAQTLHEKTFTLATDSEVQLNLTALSSKGDWAIKGREAATVTINVDGAYQQDVILFGGSGPFVYRLSLGALKAGQHKIEITHNQKQSAAEAGAPVIQMTEVLPVKGKDTREQHAVAHAPIIVARPDTVGRFSDIPLLLSYEFVPGNELTIRYTAIFTNEDGGTQTAALMARWGRATDIEWVYEVVLDAAGNVAKATFQGSNHRVVDFAGDYVAHHPVFYVATINNNFSDKIVKKDAPGLRFALAPIEHDSLKFTREALMDKHPWTHRVMAAEMLREGRLAANDEEIAGLKGMRMKIADFRRYVYIDFQSDLQNAGVSFAVKLKGDPHWYASDLGNPSFRIARNGWVRTTVRLPKTVQPAQVESLAVKCDALPETFTNRETIPQEPICHLTGLSKAFLLKSDMTPGPTLPWRLPQPLKLGVGEMRALNQ